MATACLTPEKLNASISDAFFHIKTGMIAATPFYERPAASHIYEVLLFKKGGTRESLIQQIRKKIEDFTLRNHGNFMRLEFLIKKITELETTNQENMIWLTDLREEIVETYEAKLVGTPEEQNNISFEKIKAKLADDQRPIASFAKELESLIEGIDHSKENYVKCLAYVDRIMTRYLEFQEEIDEMKEDVLMEREQLEDRSRTVSEEIKCEIATLSQMAPGQENIYKNLENLLVQFNELD